MTEHGPPVLLSSTFLLARSMLPCSSTGNGAPITNNERGLISHTGLHSGDRCAFATYFHPFCMALPNLHALPDLEAHLFVVVLHHKQCCYVMFAPITTLKYLHPPPGNLTKLSIDQALLYPIVRSSCSINYGDFILIAWRGYTKWTREWDAKFNTLTTECKQHPPPNFPPADYAWGICTFTEGVFHL